MATGDGNYGTGGIDARTSHEPIINGALESERRSAKIANGGKASHQCIGGFVGRHDIVLTYVSCKGGSRGRGYHHSFPRLVGPPRHHDEASACQYGRFSI